MQILKTSYQRIKLKADSCGLSHIHFAIATLPSLFLVYVTIQEIWSLMHSALAWHWGSFIFSVIKSLFGILLPVLILLKTYLMADSYHKEAEKKRFGDREVIFQIFLYIAIMFWLFVITFITLMLEYVASVPEVLLTTAICSMLFIIAGIGLTNNLPAGRRVIVLTVFLSIILYLGTVGWSTRRPFARDMYKIRVGMTGAQVQSIMYGYFDGRNEEEWERPEHLDPDYTGSKGYRHTNEWWGNVDWGGVEFQDGRVISVEICLCD